MPRFARRLHSGDMIIEGVFARMLSSNFRCVSFESHLRNQVLPLEESPQQALGSRWLEFGLIRFCQDFGHPSPCQDTVGTINVVLFVVLMGELVFSVKREKVLSSLQKQKRNLWTVFLSCLQMSFSNGKSRGVMTSRFQVQHCHKLIPAQVTSTF